jgi:hypothetical protein
MVTCNDRFRDGVVFDTELQKWIHLEPVVTATLYAADEVAGSKLISTLSQINNGETE